MQTRQPEGGVGRGLVDTDRFAVFRHGSSGIAEFFRSQRCQVARAGIVGPEAKTRFKNLQRARGVPLIQANGALDEVSIGGFLEPVRNFCRALKLSFRDQQIRERELQPFGVARRALECILQGGSCLSGIPGLLVERGQGLPGGDGVEDRNRVGQHLLGLFFPLLGDEKVGKR